jgi:uncharacterized protein (TIGR02246 family)
MRTRLLSLLALLALAVGLTAWPGLGQEPKGKAGEVAAIHKQAEAFVKAFHKADAKALAAFWTADGDYTDQTGRHLKGREAIEKAFRELFSEHKDLKVRITGLSLRFVSPDVAIEDGTSEVFSADGAPPSRTRYTNVHVKKDGQWLLSSVRDAPYAPPSNYEHLRGLEWAIGEWAAENDRGEAERLSLSWTDNQNFILGTFTASVRGVSVGRATHWVGWDPQAKRVRSWIFDATGGFGEGAWTRDGNRWIIKTKSVLQDGKNATGTFVLGRVGAQTLSLQHKDRTVDGKAVPDTKEFKLKRVK